MEKFNKDSAITLGELINFAYAVFNGEKTLSKDILGLGLAGELKARHKSSAEKAP